VIPWVFEHHGKIVRAIDAQSPEKVTQPPVTRLQKQLPGSAQEENQR
jgi:hypothetical protein